MQLHGLYAITDGSTVPVADLVARAAAALRGGARIIQYRDKSGDRDRRLHEATALQQLCAQSGTPLIINDDVELARTVGARGVHLGADDPAPDQAREQLGANAIIGVSCYNRLTLAVAAERQGADYVAFGSFFTSISKPRAVPANIELLRQARRELVVPLVAIGGITPENGAALLAAGADMLAVIDGVFGQAYPEAAARRYAELFI